MSHFDNVAAEFDAYRALPDEVPRAIRDALRAEVGDAAGAAGARLLDLGAGTGRIGEAFVRAGDAYFAVDSSAGMLARFARKVGDHGGPEPRLVQADGRSLPFPAGTFHAVLVAQVVSAFSGWRRLVGEARRVLRPGGTLAFGKTVRPENGLDARMRERLSLILAGMGVDNRRPGASRDDVRGVLSREARRASEVVVATWDARRSPRDFLNRHATAARFGALPIAVREDALRGLADWASGEFASLDAALVEPTQFVLDVYAF
jgi:SAM-dependent methyltransferase